MSLGNWAFVEAKKYDKGGVARDIEKLRMIEKKIQRWVLAYRVRTKATKQFRLRVLMERAFKGDLVGEALERSFSTFDAEGNKAKCEIYLRRIGPGT